MAPEAIRNWAGWVLLASLVVGLTSSIATEVASDWLWGNWISIAAFAIGAVATAAIVNENRFVDRDLERRVGPRRISRWQKERLVGLLSKAPTELSIVARLFDAESAEFAQDLGAIFREAGWTIPRVGTAWTATERGVFVGMVEGSGDEARASEPILDALRGVGVDVKIRSIPKDQLSTIPAGFQPGILYLMVGTKP